MSIVSGSLSLVVAAIASAQTPVPEIEGRWLGTLELPGGGQLPLVLNVDANGVATLDSPAQNANGISVDSVSLVDDQLSFTISSLSIRFEGQMNADGTAVEGTFTQGPAQMPLTLRRASDDEAAAVESASMPIPELEGHWQGDLTLPNGVALPLVLNVDDQGVASLDSPAQDAMDIPINSIQLEGQQVRFTSDVLAATFEGQLDNAGDQIDGTFTQRGIPFPLILERSASPDVAFNRPQNPLEPYPYRVEEVRFDNPAAEGVSLAGALTLPEGVGPFPAAVMITGSGPQDRDETIFNHKPFWIIADYLTRRGIAVLRYDDRGTAESTGDFSTATSADFAADTEAAVKYLLSRDDIDAGQIGLIGHSEGGLIAPMVARNGSPIAWTVLIAGPAVDGVEILIEQAQLIAQATGQTPQQVETIGAQQRAVIEAFRAHPDNSEVRHAALTEILIEGGMEPSQAEPSAAALATPWLAYFIEYDPAPALQALDAPTLAIFGENDLQVPATQNAAPMQTLVPQADVVILPGLNHLMQTSETGTPLEYGAIEETVSPTALEAIGNWIVHTVGIGSADPIDEAPLAP